MIKELFLSIERQSGELVAVIPSELANNFKFLKFKDYDFIY